MPLAGRVPFAKLCSQRRWQKPCWAHWTVTVKMCASLAPLVLREITQSEEVINALMRALNDDSRKCAPRWRLCPAPKPRSQIWSQTLASYPPSHVSRHSERPTLSYCEPYPRSINLEKTCWAKSTLTPWYPSKIWQYCSSPRAAIASPFATVFHRASQWNEKNSANHRFTSSSHIIP